MAGVYGDINSRVDFHRVLHEASIIARGILTRTPQDATIQRILKQLDAMDRWSANSRTPTEGERRSVDVGLIAAREFDGAKGELNDLAEKLFALNNYFEDWPTDEAAASATDEDFFEDEDDDEGDEKAD
ncbi:MAG: hypothetical protein WCA15_18610 [Candidatus Acidiferrales bacterium]